MSNVAIFENDDDVLANSGMNSQPTVRVLKVLSSIARHGPITLKQLCSYLPYSRAAIWRAATVLNETGFVTTRSPDAAYILTDQLDELVSDAQTISSEVVELRSVLRPFIEDALCHISIGCFTALGRFRLIESTDRNAELNRALSFVEEDIAMAALIALPDKRMKAHVTAFLNEVASSEDTEFIDSGLFNELIDQRRRSSLIWSPDFDYFCLPWSGDAGQTFAAKVCLRRVSQNQKNHLRKLVRELEAKFFKEAI